MTPAELDHPGHPFGIMKASTVQLTELLEHGYPDPAETMLAATSAAKDWRALRTRHALGSLDARTLELLTSALRPTDTELASLNWDEAARLYYASLALENGRRDLRQAANSPLTSAEVLGIDTEFDRLHELLMFPRAPLRFDSPVGYHPEKVRGAFRSLFLRAPP